MTSPELIASVRVAIGLVFGLAVAQKLRAPNRFVAELGHLDILPQGLLAPVAALLIAAELAIAVSHLANVGVAVAAPATLVLLGLFISWTTWILAQGRSVPCLCFGADHQEVVSSNTLVRLILLAVAEVLVWNGIGGVPASSLRPPAEGEASLLAFASALLGTVAIAWVLSVPDIKNLVGGCSKCRGRQQGR